MDFDRDGRLDLFVANYVEWTIDKVPPQLIDDSAAMIIDLVRTLAQVASGGSHAVQRGAEHDGDAPVGHR